MSTRDFDDFDPFALDYAKIHDQNLKFTGGSSLGFSEERVARVAHHEKAHAKEELQILDLGCGDGSSEVFFNHYFPRATITGIDISKNSIELAQLRHLPNCHFYSFDGQSIQTEDEAFDLIFVAGVLHHVAFSLHLPLLRECHRVLKPGGRLYIYEHNPLNPLTRYLVNTCVFDKDAKLLRASYLTRVLGEAGFKKSTTEFFIFFPRFKLFKGLVKKENKLSHLPLGGKYCVRTSK